MSMFSCSKYFSMNHDIDTHHSQQKELRRGRATPSAHLPLSPGSDVIQSTVSINVSEMIISSHHRHHKCRMLIIMPAINCSHLKIIVMFPSNATCCQITLNCRLFSHCARQRVYHYLVWHIIYTYAGISDYYVPNLILDTNSFLQSRENCLHLGFEKVVTHWLLTELYRGLWHSVEW